MVVEVGAEDFFRVVAGLGLDAVGSVVGVDGVEFGGCVVGVVVEDSLDGLGCEEAAAWGVDAELVVTVGVRNWFFGGVSDVSDVFIFDEGGAGSCDFVEGLGLSNRSGTSV